MSKFIQIHSLVSYPAALLNRDDAGLAKRMPYGGASRIRISSQCLKRHWRLVEDEWSLKSLGAPMGVRSREIVEREIKPKLKTSEAVADAVCAALVRHLYGRNSAAIKDRQALLLGRPEIEYLTQVTQAMTISAMRFTRFSKRTSGTSRRNPSHFDVHLTEMPRSWRIAPRPAQLCANARPQLPNLRRPRPSVWTASPAKACHQHGARVPASVSRSE
jgi:hypothetical protein